MTHYATAQRGWKPAASLLVVGATPEDRDTISDALRNDAYDIMFCDSLDTTDLRRFDLRPYDACVMELNQPVETCFDLLTAIRSSCPLTEVIIFSRLADEDLWIELIQRGVYDFLPKPLDRKELQRIVKNAVEKNRTRHQ